MPSTDYTAYSIDQMLASVSEPDEASAPQLEAWVTIVATCEAMTLRLRTALGQLMHRWVPNPGSAAEQFQIVVQGLIDGMYRDAEDADKMRPALTQIVNELAVAKSNLSAIADQQNRYVAVEQARITDMENGAVGVSGLAKDPAPPDGWRGDLHHQATVVLRTADANILAYGRAMPTWSPVVEHVSIGEGRASVRLGPTSGGSTQLAGNEETLVRPRGLDPQVGLTHFQVSPPPVLAGMPGLGAISQRSLSDSQDRLREADSEIRDGLQAVPVAGGGPGMSRLLPVNGIIGSPADPPRSASRAGSTRSVESGIEPSRPPSGPLMSPPMGASRGGQSAERSSIRRGGRPALWSSQRRRKASDPTDPWTVASGVPPVIEAPDPPEHDPGPGVIGSRQ
jgi:hypothetical protein